MRGGQLVWVRTDDAPPAGAAPGAPAAPVNEWTLPATHDMSLSGDNSSADFKEPIILLLRAGSKSPLEEASKIYLHFSLANVDRKRLGQAILQLTAGRKGSVKVKANPYQMNIWALKPDTAAVWDDLMTWRTAPGNDPASAGGMREDQAVLLTSFDIPANPETGDRLQISAQSLLQFIRDYPGNDLILVLTGDEDTDHKGGWRFTSIEDAERFQPPTLLLKAR